MSPVYQKNDSHRKTMDYVILSTELRGVVDLVGMNSAYYLLFSDLTMNTTTNNRQTFAHISYIHYTYTMLHTKNHLHSSNEENSQHKRADLDGNSTSPMNPPLP